MGYVDLILNLAGLLLWLNWCSLPFDPINKRTPATLAGTLRRTGPSQFRRWHLLAAMGALLILRALLYWWIGPAAHWTAKLNLGVISLSFRSDQFGRMFLYSFFSLVLTAAIFYLWLLLLSLLSPSTANSGSIDRLVRMCLGGMDGWSRRAKIITPFAAVAPLWWLASWPLTWLDIIPKPVSAAHRLEESLVIGLGSYLAWKWVAAVLLVLHLLNTYIYFGKHPLWNYVNVTAQTLLTPLRKIPLRAGSVDFAPVAGIAIVFLAGGLAERGLDWLYTRLPF